VNKVFGYVTILFVLSLSIGRQGYAQIRSTPNDTLDNRRVSINKIYIIGNEKTLTSIITRELSFKEKDTLEFHRLKGYQIEDRNKIYNTNLFISVEIQILEIEEDVVEILVNLSERWYLYPGVIFKLSDRNFNDWWVNRNHDFNRVNYGLRLNKFNMRGRDETLFLTAQFGFENLFLFTYIMPYIDKNQKIGLSVDAGYAEFKNLPYKTVDHLPSFLLSRDLQKRSFATSTSISYRNSFYTKHYITAGYKSANISDTVSVLNPEYFSQGKQNQSYFKLSYTFSRDYRDNHTYPLRGDWFTATLGNSGLGINPDFNRWYLLMSYNKYFDLGKGYFFGSYFGGHLSTASVPYANYIGLGYDNYIVRGYELTLIEGPATGLLKSSLRKQLFKKSIKVEQAMPLKQFQNLPFTLYAKTFFDAGYVKNYPNYAQSSRLANKPLYSLGLGLDLVMLYDFTLRLEESYNAEGLFHFAIGFKHDL
jgi:outer membrane protein assembly factor BamA